MSNKTELKFIKAIVKSILETDQRARNSDSYLYLKVIEYIAEQIHISLSDITILHFLNHMNDYGFPPFESVRRARQKHQGKEEYTDMLLMCKEALEKQIPKKPTKREYVPNGTLVYGYCPECDSFTKNFFRYCRNCGQALDWSDTE